MQFFFHLLHKHFQRFYFHDTILTLLCANISFQSLMNVIIFYMYSTELHRHHCAQSLPCLSLHLLNVTATSLNTIHSLQYVLVKYRVFIFVLRVTGFNSKWASSLSADQRGASHVIIKQSFKSVVDRYIETPYMCWEQFMINHCQTKQLSSPRSKNVSSRVVSQSGGWGMTTVCIKINYSEPKTAESREGSSVPAESSCTFLGDVVLGSDRLTKFKGFWRAILTGCWQRWRFGPIPTVMY